MFDQFLFNFFFPSWNFSRYPFEEAATVSISTVKEFANDIKEVTSVFILLQYCHPRFLLNVDWWFPLFHLLNPIYISLLNLPTHIYKRSASFFWWINPILFSHIYVINELVIAWYIIVYGPDNRWTS